MFHHLFKQKKEPRTGDSPIQLQIKKSIFVQLHLWKENLKKFRLSFSNCISCVFCNHLLCIYNVVLHSAVAINEIHIFIVRAVNKLLSSRLITNRRQHWNSHQRHNFLRAEASRDILKFRVSEMAFPGVFKRYFPLQKPCCFVRKHARLGTAIEMSQAFHDIARFEHFTPCLNMYSMSFKTGKWMLYNFI